VLSKSDLRLLALLAVDESGSFVVETVQPVWLLVNKVAVPISTALDLRRHPHFAPALHI
jgi:hypothetical protein